MHSCIRVLTFVLYCVGGSKVPVAVYTSKTATYVISTSIIAYYYCTKLALEQCCLSPRQESSVTLHLIPVSSDLNSHICAHTMLKAWGTQKWLLCPSSLKLLIVKKTSCSSKDLTLVRIRWRWFGTLTIMLVEITC